VQGIFDFRTKVVPWLVVISTIKVKYLNFLIKGDRSVTARLWSTVRYTVGRWTKVND
jgi:hypothetical protein